MKKTTVYLDDLEAEGLRELAARTGKAQAELVREGIRRILDQAPKRVFHSMGRGDWDGGPIGHWTADELYRKVFPNR